MTNQPHTDNQPNILNQQIDYYRARASEYDEWFYRVGRYDHGEDLNAQWFNEADAVRRALHALGPVNSALDLACGTGIWTCELVQIADHVTALDAAPEVLAINREKLAGANVTYQETDLFAWEPTRRYDLVFFGFWLSHVPADRLAPFLNKVAQATQPDGHVFMVDSRPSPVSGVPGRTLPVDNSTVLTRELKDGRTFDIVKIFYEPDALTQHFAAAGLLASVRTTPQFFIYAQAQPRPRPVNNANAAIQF